MVLSPSWGPQGQNPSTLALTSIRSGRGYWSHYISRSISGPTRAKRMNERDRRRFRVASDNVQERERPARGRRRRRNMGRRLLRAVSLSQTLQNITKSSHINCMSQMNLIKSSCQLPTREISSQWNVEWKGDGGRQAGRPPPTLFVPPLGLTCIKTFLWSGVILAFC